MIAVHDEDVARAFEEGWEMGPREGGGTEDGSRLLDPGLPGRRIAEITSTLGIEVVNFLGPLRSAASAERVYYRGGPPGRCE